MPVVHQDTMLTVLWDYVLINALKVNGYMVKIVYKLVHLAITAIPTQPAQPISNVSFLPTAQLDISQMMSQFSVSPNARAVSEIHLLASASPPAQRMVQMFIILIQSLGCVP